MAGLEEALGAKGQLAAALAVGVDTIAFNQTITFDRYIRLVLPLDGYIFWVKDSMVGPSALANALIPNMVSPNQPPVTFPLPAPQLTVQCSLHYATDVRQEPDEFYAAHRIILTSESEVNDLAAVAPNTLWIGTFQGKRFAFSSRSSFFAQADLFHYVGFAVYPDMETQIIDSPAGFDANSVIVSNSLPAWLALNGYAPGYGFKAPVVTLFPGYLAPENLPPPFGTVDVNPQGTQAMASVPTLTRNSSHYQLCADTVKVTLWGTRNADAMNFIDRVYQYSGDETVNAFGITNMPVIHDEQRTQSELGTLAQKKTIEFEISYLQEAMRNIAVQTIISAIPSFTVHGVSAFTPSLDFSDPRNSQYSPLI